MLVGQTEDGRIVYDHELNPLFSTKYTISEMSSTEDFFMLYDGETKKAGIMYKNGAIVLEPKYGNITYNSI